MVARCAAFNTAIDASVPGGRAAVQTNAYRLAPLRVAPHHNVDIKFAASPPSASIGTLAAGSVVAVRPGPPSLTELQIASGVRGFAPADAFPALSTTSTRWPTG